MIYTWFKRWSENGLLWEICYALKQYKQIQIGIVFMGSTSIKLHRHAARSVKKGSKALEKMQPVKARNWISSWAKKRQVLGVQITDVQVHNSRVTKEMLCRLNLSGSWRIVADKRYDDSATRFELKQWRVQAETSGRTNRILKPRYDKPLYRWRYRIENLFCKLKENRRLGLRVDKLAVIFMGFVALALIKIYIC